VKAIADTNFSAAQELASGDLGTYLIIVGVVELVA
jgi:hypothetical protein